MTVEISGQYVESRLFYSRSRAARAAPRGALAVVDINISAPNNRFRVT
ncbi:MAG: hypothetical protein ACKOB4_03570 [Acidobacteriota bacterium]